MGLFLGWEELEEVYRFVENRDETAWLNAGENMVHTLQGVGPLESRI